MRLVHCQELRRCLTQFLFYRNDTSVESRRPFLRLPRWRFAVRLAIINSNPHRASHVCVPATTEFVRSGRTRWDSRKGKEMATVSTARVMLDNGYPTSDGKPMAETDWHRDLMVALIQTLTAFFTEQPRVYVSGNLLVCYDQRNGRRHVSPDVYIIAEWPSISVPTISCGRRETHPGGHRVDLGEHSGGRPDRKSDPLPEHVASREHFLFDPFGEYLDPQLQGFRLRNGVIRPIRRVDGRLPSQGLRLHLEPSGQELRLFNPQTGLRLPTPLNAKVTGGRRGSTATPTCRRGRRGKPASAPDHRRTPPQTRHRGPTPDVNANRKQMATTGT